MSHTNIKNSTSEKLIRKVLVKKLKPPNYKPINYNILSPYTLPAGGITRSIIKRSYHVELII